MNLTDRLDDIPQLNPSQKRALKLSGYRTVLDVFNNYPRKYEDYSKISNIRYVKPGLITIKAKINNFTSRYTRSRLHITEAIASDPSGSLRLVWFNQPYRIKQIKTDEEYFLSGKFGLAAGRMVLTNPACELAVNIPKNSAKILSIYRETKVLDSKQLRSVMLNLSNYLNLVNETLPNWLMDDYNLINKKLSIKSVHMPLTMSDLDKAKKRLGFEEVFCLSLASLYNRLEIKKETALSVKFNQELAKKFVSNLNFKLTNGQKLTVWEIYKDLEKIEPMNRIVEGDVGSGKTVVAAMAALMVINQKMQVAFMAPTEILARQHAETISNLLKPLKQADKVQLLIGAMTLKQKQAAYTAIKNNEVSIIVGTQALIQDNVDMHSLALIIIDEQHRFGVNQRKALMVKAGHMPHVLSLSATPIPRSLALTLYGELDISLLKEKPAKRLPIKTKIVNYSARNSVFEAIKKEVQAGRQIFIVCPAISETEDKSINSIDEIYKLYSQTIFKKYRLAELHGQLSNDKKQQVMTDFINKKIDILVTTTVIEVGVDVPNATVMLILSPDRFGLAQLHQLRGRVGRSHHQGYCYLLINQDEQPSKRLYALESTNDGFKLAELDLDIRGPGAIYGTMQHGAIDLRIANLSDQKLIKSAVNAARQFVDKKEDLLKYKELNKIVTRLRAVTNLN